MARPRCTGMHKVLIVDQWTALGAFVRCVLCGAEFHETRPYLETHYLGCEHTSPHGVEHDVAVFLVEEEAKNQ